MIYMLEVNMLIAAVVFGLAGLFILALFAWTQAKESVDALRAMQRITAATGRDRFAISRVSSRYHNGGSDLLVRF
jgi:hypothetical protein